MRARALFAGYAALAALWILIAGETAVVPARAQECAGCAPAQALLATSTDGWTVHKQVNEVEVFFTASRHGKFVDGVTRGDVNVRDNDKPADIIDFRDQNNLPLRIALLVDTSDSVRERLGFEKEAANAFLRQALSRDADSALVGGFSTKLRVTQDFTHDPKLLHQGLNALAPGGGTAMYDSIQRACEMLAGSADRRDLEARVLIILSDGDDNLSRIKRAAAIASAQQFEVTIYAISTNYSIITSGNENLKQLAIQTGGQALFPVSVRRLTRAFVSIGNELRHRYAVAYRPQQFDANGRFRSIHIWAKKSGKKLKVKARKGYYAR